MNDIKLETEIVRNSEILQEHREEIDDLRADVDMLINRDVVGNTENKVYIRKLEEQKVSLKGLVSTLIAIVYAGNTFNQVDEEIYEKVSKLREEYEELMEE